MRPTAARLILIVGVVCLLVALAINQHWVHDHDAARDSWLLAGFVLCFGSFLVPA